MPRKASASLLCKPLQSSSNARIIEQGCAGIARATRNHGPHSATASSGRIASPICPDLSSRQGQPVKSRSGRQALGLRKGSACVVVQGSDLYKYARWIVLARHPKTINAGVHVIHTGGKHNFASSHSGRSARKVTCGDRTSTAVLLGMTFGSISPIGNLPLTIIKAISGGSEYSTY